MNKLLSLSVFTILIFILTACTLGVDTDGEVVTVYSERHYDTDQALFDQFETETGIEVQVIKAGADELITRLETEGEDTSADVLIVSDAGRLHLAKDKGLLQSVESDVIETNVPSQYRDIDNMWIGLTMRARVLVYHPDRVNESELSTYEALSESEFNDRIVVRTGSNIYNQSLVASFLEIHDEAYVRNFISRLVDNFARAPQGNDRDQAKAVMAGEADIAIMNTYYMGKMANSSDSYEVDVANALNIFFPNQETTGTHVNVSGAGVTKHAPNTENAVKLIEFLTSESAQSSFANANYEYPVNPLVNPSDLLASWGTFVAQDISLTALGENANQAAIIMDEEGWN